MKIDFSFCLIELIYGLAIGNDRVQIFRPLDPFLGVEGPPGPIQNDSDYIFANNGPIFNYFHLGLFDMSSSFMMSVDRDF